MADTPVADAERRDPPGLGATARPATALILLCCLGAFMAFLDSTIVNVAFPGIERQFKGSDLPTLSWVLNGYNVVIAALLMPAGRAADRLGCRRSFVVGLVVFTVASAACGAAGSVELLIAARLVQAIGAAILVPTSLALLMPMFSMARRLVAITIWGAAAALAAGIGPGLGGLLTEHWSWRAVFWVNLPIGAVAVWASRRLGEQRDRSGPRPDLLGTVLLAVGLGLLALGLVKGHDWDWSSARTIGCLIGGAVLVAVVLVLSSRHPAPVVALDLLRSRSALAGNLGSMLFAVTFYAVILNNILFLNNDWHWTLLSAGLATTPPPIATALVARPAIRLAELLGDRITVAIGCLVYCAGTLLLSWGAGQHPDFVTHWLPGAAVMGVGAGLVWPVLGNVAMAGVEPARLATASAANAAFRQLGAVLGTALAVSIVSSAGRDLLHGARNTWVMAICFALAVAVLVSATLPGRRRAGVAG
ncbi:MFS transporter [Kitasatospora viridis]|uniref:EmrB/QacA subfamily drug resistance transporter n=1 Tax=Kitasatospora viridis TaxID=281105 RepID=A0A561UJ81_9ACTN|nr:MFS transporter [Kitasatospora viridis]TWF99404.1 EmrB/QacA subfamily drug resistance transporter [Kitasatospora viridis]